MDSTNEFLADPHLYGAARALGNVNMDAIIAQCGAQIGLHACDIGLFQFSPLC